MQAFVLRLNPDPREGGVPYTKYPTQKEYREIHESSPMDGFHEAVNFLPESGIIRGYLPPKHLLSIRSGKPFVLITITAKTAKIGGDMIVGIQAGCRYDGDNSRSGGTQASRALKFNWHYSCGESMSLVLNRQVPNARKLVLGRNGTWVRGPTYEIGRPALKRLIGAIGKSLTTKEERRKFAHISKILGGVAIKTLPKVSENSNFELDVADALRSDLSHVVGMRVPDRVEVRTYQYQRDPRVAAYALKHSNGTCGDCGNHAPFKSSKTGLPYLEVHHIKMLKDGGADTTDNVVALCPNCHRKRHYG
ncbi:HNH endonuclease [Dyella sp.]|uniref:HNH endonuclease n=1 Tax=Dyella sp. TaxID=1869338 RepID=UPI003F80479F